MPWPPPTNSSSHPQGSDQGLLLGSAHFGSQATRIWASSQLPISKKPRKTYRKTLEKKSKTHQNHRRRYRNPRKTIKKPLEKPWKNLEYIETLPEHPLEPPTLIEKQHAVKTTTSTSLCHPSTPNLPPSRLSTLWDDAQSLAPCARRAAARRLAGLRRPNEGGPWKRKEGRVLPSIYLAPFISVWVFLLIAPNHVVFFFCEVLGFTGLSSRRRFFVFWSFGGVVLGTS